MIVMHVHLIFHSIVPSLQIATFLTPEYASKMKLILLFALSCISFYDRWMEVMISFQILLVAHLIPFVFSISAVCF